MFGGKDDGKTVASQTVNPEHTEKIDNINEHGKGVAMLHEVLEAYIGGQDSHGTGPATFDKSTPEFQNYKNAHDKTMATDPRFKEP